MDLSSITRSVAIVAGVCFAFGALIAFVHRRFRVDEDPRIDATADLLPGTNCGACGTPGCRAFAEALVTGDKQPAQCTVMGEEDRQDVALFLGVDAGEAVKRVARLLCAGGRDVATQNAEYLGFSSCKAAAAIASGGKGCTWGCLGLADCELACDFDAIHMGPTGLPVVTPELCTACGDCVDACPKDLFVIMPLEQELLVQCRSQLEGDEAEALCSVACNGCGKCALDAGPGVIDIVNGLATIDYAKYDQVASGAADRCPTGAILWVRGAQFPESGGLPAGAPHEGESMRKQAT